MLNELSFSLLSFFFLSSLQYWLVANGKWQNNSSGKISTLYVHRWYRSILDSGYDFISSSRLAWHQTIWPEALAKEIRGLFNVPLLTGIVRGGCTIIIAFVDYCLYIPMPSCSMVGISWVLHYSKIWLIDLTVPYVVVVIRASIEMLTSSRHKSRFHSRSSISWPSSVASSDSSSSTSSAPASVWASTPYICSSAISSSKFPWCFRSSCSIWSSWSSWSFWSSFSRSDSGRVWSFYLYNEMSTPCSSRISTVSFSCMHDYCCRQGREIDCIRFKVWLHIEVYACL